MTDKKEEVFRLYTEGRSNQEISKLLDIPISSIRDMKNSVEWAVAHEKWENTHKQDTRVMFLSHSQLIINEMIKMIRNKNTPPSVKADLLKYVGARIWGDTRAVALDVVGTKQDKNDTEALTDIPTVNHKDLENIKKQIAKR